MSEQAPTQVRTARSIGGVLEVLGVVVGLAGVFGGLVLAVNVGVVPGLAAGLGAVVSGAVVYGLGQVLDTLAAILLEVWEQGGD